MESRVLSLHFSRFIYQSFLGTQAAVMLPSVPQEVEMNKESEFPQCLAALCPRGP